MKSIVKKLLFSFVLVLLFLNLANSQDAPKRLVNINKDPIELLVTLPGIGYGLAKRIVDYREFKKFENIEEILEIDGIGTGNFEKFKDMITVDE